MCCTKLSANSFDMWNMSPSFDEVVQHHDSLIIITHTLIHSNIRTMDVLKMTTQCEHKVLPISYYAMSHSSWFNHSKDIYLIVWTMICKTRLINWSDWSNHKLMVQTVILVEKCFMQVFRLNHEWIDGSYLVPNFLQFTCCLVHKIFFFFCGSLITLVILFFFCTK